MTRKRFIKLVMSHEIQRNKAERIAENVAQYGSYETMYQVMKAPLQLEQRLVRANRTWKWFKEGIIRTAEILVNGLVPAVRRMAESVRAAQEARLLDVQENNN